MSALDQGFVIEAEGDELASSGLVDRRQVAMAADGATRPRPIGIRCTGRARRVGKLHKIFDTQHQSTVLSKYKQLLNDTTRRGTWSEREADQMEKQQWWDTIHIVAPGAAWSSSSSEEHGLHTACNA